MKKIIAILAVAVFMTACGLAACAAPAAKETQAVKTPVPTEAPAPSEAPSAEVSDAPAASAAAATEAPTEAVLAEYEPDAPAGGVCEDDSDFFAVAGNLNYDDIVEKFGEPSFEKESKADDVETLACYYRNDTLWFKKENGGWILDGITIWRPSSPYDLEGVKVAMPTDEAMEKLNLGGYVQIDNEARPETNENITVFQKGKEGALQTVKLVDSPEDGMITQIAAFARDVYQIPEDVLEPGGED